MVGSWFRIQKVFNFFLCHPYLNITRVFVVMKCVLQIYTQLLLSVMFHFQMLWIFLKKYFKNVFENYLFTSGYLEPDNVLSAPMIDTSQTIVKLSSGSQVPDVPRLFKEFVSINFLNPQESGLAFNEIYCHNH